MGPSFLVAPLAAWLGPRLFLVRVDEAPCTWVWHLAAMDRCVSYDPRLRFFFKVQDVGTQTPRCIALVFIGT